VRPHRSIALLARVLPLAFLAGALHGQTILVTLGASSGSGSGCALSAGQVCTLTAAVTGTPNTAVTFHFNPSVTGAVVGTPSTSNGQTRITYTAPTPIAAAQTVSVTATSNADGTSSNTVQITLVPFGVTVSPSTVTLTQSASQVFTATLTGGAIGTVAWSLNPSVGTIYPSGANTAYYLAPPGIPVSQKVTVTATATNADGAVATGTATITLNNAIQVGDGAPGALPYLFQQAFQRNGFSQLVSLPPLGTVKTLGSNGYVQEFADANNDSGVKLALVTADMATAPPQTPVYQLLAPLYSFYSSTGVGTAGYPTMDTQTCPSFDPANFCQWDTFDKGVALFAYSQAITAGQNFSITGAFYTEWIALGGITGPGRPVSAQVASQVAAPIPPAAAGTQYTVQSFGVPNSGGAAGGIYSITSGANKGKIFGVIEPLYDLYVSLGGPSGQLGLPTSEALQINSSGLVQQNFEGGALQYTAATGPTLLVPVASVKLGGAAPGSSTALSLGQTVTLTATPFAPDGITALTGRPVSWTTTNAQVVSVQATPAANGAPASAVVTAVGPGAASVQASSGGVASAKVNFVVTAPCCQIGDGAPANVQQAFVSALARNRITVAAPVPSPAMRVANGYVQMLPAAGGSLVMVAQSDTLGTAYVVAGPLLAAYQALGGPAGSLGYPASDASAGGTQLFANNAALSGNPVRLVSGVILSKWTLMGYETGAAGLPQSDAAPFTTPGANSGQQQSFRGGAIYGATAGPRAGQAYFVSGLILARYTQLGGPAGDLGMPVSDEFSSGGLRQQNFEGGSVTYAPGDAAASEHLAPRVPAVIVSPAAVTAGGTVRLAVTGFANGATLRISVAGEPDFTVSTPNGAYSWQMAVPLTARSATVAIHAADTASSATADGTLTINGFNDHRVQMSKVQGDNQTGPPGALLAAPLQVQLVDAGGAPVAGAAVTFQAAPGAVVSTASAVTDRSGYASTAVRLPPAEGTTAVTATASGIAQAPVTFYLRAAASTLTGFPNWIMAGSTPLGNGTATIGQKGALLTAAASILRYRQNRGELRAPNGQVDPGTLNSYLTSYCTVDVNGNQLCDGYLAASQSGEQIVNLWRAADFTGGVDVVAVAPAAVSTIADLLAQGEPALVSLALSQNGAPAGGNFVVAIGVAADGSIVIQDPNPFFARTNLNDYLNGFSAGGANWKASIAGVVRFALRAPSATRFLTGALSQPPALMSALALDVQSAAGACGVPVDLWDAIDSSGNPPAGGAAVSRLDLCDGLQPAYQISVGAAQPFHAFLTDLATAGQRFDLSGSAPATYAATRSQLNLTVAPQAASFADDGIVNGATFSPGIAPGGVVTIFGTGLAGPATATTLDFDGTPATVLLASPFQVNAVVPPGISPGNHTVHVVSAFGAAQQTVAVAAAAPAIFQIGRLGAITNQDGALNSPSNPLPRGQALVIYCTGLGVTASQGQLQSVVTPVSVVLNGQTLKPSFAGQTPGFPGLYQVNVVVPANTPPGLGGTLALQQGGITSNVVNVAVQ